MDVITYPCWDLDSPVLIKGPHVVMHNSIQYNVFDIKIYRKHTRTYFASNW